MYVVIQRCLTKFCFGYPHDVSLIQQAYQVGPEQAIDVESRLSIGLKGSRAGSCQDWLSPVLTTCPHEHLVGTQ